MAKHKTPPGGLLRNQRLRAAYLADPKLCQHCQGPILPGTGEKPCQARKKTFCGLKCKARHFFPAIKDGMAEGNAAAVMSGPCRDCGEPVQYSVSPRGRITKRKLCGRCLRASRQRGAGIGQATKGELFARCKNWQSARSSIQRHAAAVFASSGRPAACVVCGYSLHVQVAHVRAVSSFPAEAKVADINDIGNLAPLCPNHHWEYDNGLLSLAKPSPVLLAVEVAEDGIEPSTSAL